MRLNLSTRDLTKTTAFCLTVESAVLDVEVEDEDDAG
jgi:hypothetical protein